MVFEEVLSYFDINASSFIVKLVAAIVILLIGFVLGGVASKLLKKILKEINVNKVLREQAGIKIPFEEFVSSLGKYLIYFIALIMALNQLNVTTNVLQIILIVVLVIIIALIILAFKDYIPNVVAGFIMFQKKKFVEGQIIKVKGIEGKIVKIGLMETKIRIGKKEYMYIPNSILNKNEVILKNGK